RRSRRVLGRRWFRRRRCRSYDGYEEVLISRSPPLFSVYEPPPVSRHLQKSLRLFWTERFLRNRLSSGGFAARRPRGTKVPLGSRTSASARHPAPTARLTVPSDPRSARSRSVSCGRGGGVRRALDG